MIRNMYSRDAYSILGVCKVCGRLNYVEQHGTTAKCKCSPEWTEHGHVPYKYRFGLAQNQYHGPARIPQSESDA